MKKGLIALTVLTLCGAASAQSSMTVFGVVDATVSGYANTAETPLGVSVKTSSTGQNSSGYAGSRLGFRGTEDLGGGAAANFWLEAGLLNDTGAGISPGGGLAFNRRSTVSLSGVLGEVRLGRDYTPTFWNDAVMDPFTSNGVGLNLIATASGFNTPGQAANGFQGNPNYVRASNSVGYFLPPNLGGFYGQVMYAFNEATKYDPGPLTPSVANSQRAGRYVGGRFGYTNGPLDVAVAAARSTIGDTFAHLQVCSNGPDFFCLERCLLADQLSLVPRSMGGGVVQFHDALLLKGMAMPSSTEAAATCGCSLEPSTVLNATERPRTRGVAATCSLRLS
ncbi:porin [Variovorax sp. HW608]|uniref:porin n=1 Tax=Variovorax sp. HW608 TaxID=1034889 RepID=UPI00081FD3DA|nr:porin [Variovorax sp. HW608]SCK37444.1 porin [Variovorax sp. HW608]